MQLCDCYHPKRNESKLNCKVEKLFGTTMDMKMNVLKCVCAWKEGNEPKKTCEKRKINGIFNSIECNVRNHASSVYTVQNTI